MKNIPLLGKPAPASPLWQKSAQQNVRGRRARLASILAATAMGLGLSASHLSAGTLLLNGADITTGGTATGSPANFGAGGGTAGPAGLENPTNLFDNNAATKVLVFGGVAPGVGADITVANPVLLTYDFAGATAFTVLSYSLTSANDAPDRDPANWILQGSNDGINFITLDTVNGHAFNDQPLVGDNSNATNRFETYFFTVDTPGTYQIYQFRLTETFNPTNDRPQIAEMQMFTTVIPEPASAALFALGALSLLRRRSRN